MMAKSRLIIVGGGGFGREVLAWAADCHAAGRMPAVGGYLDDRSGLLDHLGVPWLGAPAGYEPKAGDSVVIAIAKPAIKRAVATQLRTRGAQFATLIHPSVIQGGRNAVGEGCILAPYSLNTVDTQLGDFVTLLSFSGLGHDARAGDFTTISTHVDVMGFATLGQGVFVGSGARIMPSVTVEDEATLGAGALVTRRVRRGVTVYAQSARRLTPPDRS